MNHAARSAWIAVGLVALALGGLGVALPLLPTTPFILLAAFAFANSSDRLHGWLVRHPLFGPMIANWQEHGAISRRTKWASLASMLAVVVISLALGVSMTVVWIQGLIMTCSAIFIVTRPEPPRT